MGRLVRVKATGNIIEYQSWATPGTLISNAVAAGYNAEDVEEVEVTSAEWAAIVAAIPKPTPPPTKAEVLAAIVTEIDADGALTAGMRTRLKSLLRKVLLGVTT